MRRSLALLLAIVMTVQPVLAETAFYFRMGAPQVMSTGSGSSGSGSSNNGSGGNGSGGNGSSGSTGLHFSYPLFQVHTNSTLSVPAPTVTPGSMPPLYTWVVENGTLPIGTYLNDHTGSVSGPALAKGDYSATIQVEDDSYNAGTSTLNVQVIDGLRLTAETDVSTRVGLSVSRGGPSVLNGIGTITWSSASPMPPGVTVSALGGLTGVPTTAGTYPITIGATDSQGSAASISFNIVVKPALLLASVSPVQTHVGSPINVAPPYIANSPTLPVVWSYSGILPAGTSFDLVNGIIGTATASGSWTPNFIVTDADGATATTGTSFTVLAPLTMATAPNVTLNAGTAFSINPPAIGNSPALPVTYWYTGVLPVGMSMSNASTGAISGIPTSVGVSSPITFTAVDNLGAPVSSNSFSITVTPPITLTNLNVGLATIAGNPVSKVLATAQYAVGTPYYHLYESGSDISTTLSSVCPGLTFATANALLSGTPTGPCSLYGLNVVATDSNNDVSAPSPAFGIIVSVPTLSASVSTPLNVHSGDNVSGALSSNSTSPNWTFPWTCTVGTCAALVLSAQSPNVMSGIAPVETVTSTYVITPTADGATSTPLTITITPTLALANTNLGISTIASDPVSQTLATAVNVIGTANFHLYNGAADISSTLATSCPGLTFNPTNALISGTPTAACSLPNLTLKVADTAGAFSVASTPFAITITAPVLSASLSTPASIHSGDAIAGVISSSGANPNWSFPVTCAGATCAALTLTAQSATAFAGVAPAEITASTYTITPTSDGVTATPLSLTVAPPLALANLNVGVATVAGDPVSQTLATAPNAIGTANFHLYNGATDISSTLATSCPGLTFSASSATVSGTPTVVCALSGLTLNVADSTGETSPVSPSFGITVFAPTLSANLTAPNVHSGDALTGVLSSTGTAPNWSFASTCTPAATAGACTALTLTAPSYTTLSGAAPANTTTSTYSVTASADGFSAPPFTLTVTPTLVLANTNLGISTIASNPVSQTLATAVNAIGTATFHLYNGATDISSTLAASCPGLAFSASNATVSGTPTAACSLSGLTLKVADSSGDFSAASIPFAITISAPALSASLATPSNVHPGDAVAGSLSSNGTTPNWSFSSTCAVGTCAALTLTAPSFTGFAGTAPIDTVASTYTITATADGISATTMSLTVTPAIALANPNLGVTGIAGTPVSVALATAANAIGAATFHLYSGGTDISSTLGSTCSGLAFSATSATISGTPTTACSLSGLTLAVADTSGDFSAASTAFTIAISAPALTASLTKTNVHSGDAIAGALTSTGTTPNWSFASTCAVGTCAALTLTAPSYATISGTAPVDTTTSTYTIVATADGVLAGAMSLTVTPALALANLNLGVTGIAGTPVSQTLATASNVIGTSVFHLYNSGTDISSTFGTTLALCQGLTFSTSGGTVSGTPTAACSLSGLTLKVADTSGDLSAASSTFVIAITAPSLSANLTTPAATHAGDAIAGALSSTSPNPNWTFPTTTCTPAATAGACTALTLSALGNVFQGNAPATVTVTSTYTITPTADGVTAAPITLTVYPVLTATTSGGTKASGSVVNSTWITANNAVPGTVIYSVYLSPYTTAADPTTLCPGLIFDIYTGGFMGVSTGTCTIPVNVKGRVQDATGDISALSTSSLTWTITAPTLSDSLTKSNVHPGDVIAGTLTSNATSSTWTFPSITCAPAATAGACAALTLTPQLSTTTVSLLYGIAPTDTVTSTYTINPSEGGFSPATALVLTVTPALALSNLNLGVTGVAGTSLSQTLATAATGTVISTAVFHLYNSSGSDISSTLAASCSGLAFSTSTATISGTPTAACSLSGLTLKVADTSGDFSAASTAFAITISAPTVSASLSTPANVHSGDAIAGALSSNGATPSWSFASTCTVGTCAALTLSASSYTSFAGTAPTDTVTSTYSITPAADGFSLTTPLSLTVTPALALANPSISGVTGVAGANVSQTLATANNVIGTAAFHLYNSGGTDISSTLATSCPGLTFSPSNATISGATTGTCSLTGLTLKVADTSGDFSAASTSFAITISAPAVTASLSSSNVHSGDAVAGALTSTGTTPNWSFASTCTVGTCAALTLTAPTYTTFSGTAPTDTATSTYTITATARGVSATAMSLTVTPPLALANSSISGVTGTAGTSVSQTLASANNVIGTAAFHLYNSGGTDISSTLAASCPGLIFSTSNAKISGTPTAACSLSGLTLQVADTSGDFSAASTSFAITISAPTVTANLSTPSSVHPGDAVAGSLSSNGANPNWSFSSTCTVGPCALTLSASSSTAFAGVAPAAASTSVYTITPSADGASATALSLTVTPALALANLNLGVTGVAGSPVSETLATATNVIGTSVFHLYNSGTDISSTLGTPCPGLTFSATNATISGTPTDACSLSGLTLQVADSSGDFSAASTSFPITISTPTLSASLSTPSNVHPGDVVTGVLSSASETPAWSFAATCTVGTCAALTLTALNYTTFSGTAPTDTATSTYTITASADGFPATSMTLTVTPNIALANLSLGVTGTAGTPVSKTLATAANNIGTSVFHLYNSGAVDISSTLATSCPGLIFSTSNAQISGTPTAACSQSGLTLKVADSTGDFSAASTTFAITISAPTVTASLSTPSSVHPGDAVAGALTSTGATPNWSFASTCTVGTCAVLTLSASSYTAFAGTAPADTTTSTYTITATADGVSATAMSLTVTPALALANPSISGVTGVAGTSISQTLATATNVIGTAVFHLYNSGGSDISSTLATSCPGLAFSTSTATISGAITTTCSLSGLTLKAADSTGDFSAASASFPITISAPTLSASLSTPSNVHPGDAVAGALSSNGTIPNWSFASTCTVGTCAALTLSASSYTAFVGTAPADTATSTYTITATADGVSAPAMTLTVTPALALASLNLAVSAIAGVAVSQTLATAPNAIGTAAFHLYNSGGTDISSTLGSTCPGLVFSTSVGKISGTPTAVCSLSGLTLKVADSSGDISPASIGFSITISAPTVTATLSTPSIVHPGDVVAGTLSSNGTNPNWSFPSTCTVTPCALSLSASSSTAFSGVAPAAASTSVYTITPTADGVSATALSLTVTPALSLTGVLATYTYYVGDYVGKSFATAANNIGTAAYHLYDANGNDISSTIANTCPGMSFNTSSAQFSGIGTAACSLNVTVKASDSTGDYSPASTVIPITIKMPTVSAPTMTHYTIHSGDAFGVNLISQDPNAIFTLTGSPSGLILKAAGSTYGGGNAPVVVTTTVYTLTATSAGQSLSVNLTVMPALTVTGISGVTGTAGTPVSQTLGTGNNVYGTAVYHLYNGPTEISSTLSTYCPGLSFNTTNALVSSSIYPTSACSLVGLTMTVADSSGDTSVASAPFAITISGPTASATLTPPTSIRQGNAISGTLATNEVSPVWSFSSSPSGLAPAASGSTFSGTAPSVASATSYVITATATESGINAIASPFTVNVLPAMTVSASSNFSAIVGNSFLPQTVATSSNNVGTVSWTLNQNGSAVTLSSLCAGLSFNTATAQISATSGYATGLCSLSNMTLTATDAYDATTATTSAFAITVSGDTASANLTSSTSIHQGGTIAGTLTTNETAPAWSFSSSPTGLSVTASGSTFSGIAPSVASNTTYAITATATENSQIASVSPFNVTVYPALAITAPATVSGIVGNSFSAQTMSTASNNIGTVSWKLNQNASAVTLSAICSGLSFNTATAQITATTGYATKPCSLSNMTVTATDAADGATATSTAFAITVSGNTASASLTSPTVVRQGDAISGSLTTNETSPVWSFLSSPTGLTVSASGSTFSATAPTVASIKSYAITATATENSLSAAASPVNVTVNPALAIAAQPTGLSSVVGNSFSAQTVATTLNSIGTLSWTLNQNGSAVTLSSLCTGMSFNTATAQISAPTGYTTGLCSLSNMTVTATDAYDGTTATSTVFAITVSGSSAWAGLATAVTVHPGATIVGNLWTNETAPVWTFPSSPSGLSFSAAGTVFSGTAPSVASNTTYAITPTASENSHSASASPFSLTIYPSLAITTQPSAVSGVVGNSLASQTMATASNNIGTVVWTLSQNGSAVSLSSLCAGMSFDSSTAKISAPAGFPTGSCSLSNMTVTATDLADGTTATTSVFSIAISGGATSASLTSPTAVHQGAAISGTLSSNETAPAWSLSSAPVGLSLSTSGSTFSGTAPTVASNTTFAVTATATQNSLSSSAPQFSVTVYPTMAIATQPTTISSVVGNSFSAQIMATASNNIGTVNWTLNQNGSAVALSSLCAGMNFNAATAQISAAAGYPTGACSLSNMTVTATDPADGATATSLAFSITVSADSAWAGLSTPTIVRQGAAISGTLATNEASPVWSFSSSPTGLTVAAYGSAFSGTGPAVDSPTSYAITATASQNYGSASASPLNVAVYPALRISTPSAVTSVVGDSFSAQTVATVTNNVGTLIWVLNQNGSTVNLSALCGSLSFNTATAQISAPAGYTTGSCRLSNMTATATDPFDGATITTSPFTITISGDTAWAGLSTPASVRQGSPISGTLVTNETAPVWSFLSSPTGVMLTASGSTFSGTAPMVASVTGYAIIASATENSFSASAAPISVNVYPAMTIVTQPTAVSSIVGNNFSSPTPATASNNVGTLSWKLNQNGSAVNLSALCAGMSFNAATAQISAPAGYTTGSCSLANMTVTATDGYDGTTATSNAFSITVSSDTASASLTSPATVRQGAAISGYLSTNETSPGWSFFSSPNGVSLTASGSNFSGTAPTVAATTTFAITAIAAQHSLGASASPFSVTVYPSVAITTQTSAVFSVVGDIFSAQTVATVTNNVGTVSWTLNRNGSVVNLSTLCAGMSFNSATAQIYAPGGYPTQSCSLSNISVTATDSFDKTTATSSAFSITVAGDSASASLTTPVSIRQGNAISGTLSTNETAPVWSYSSSPVGLWITGSGSTFSATAPTIDSVTTYAITATATENSFTASTSPVNVTVYPAMVIATQPTAVSGIVGNNFSSQAMATTWNNIGTVSWTLKQNGSAITLSSLCSGLSFNTVTGQIYASAGYATGSCSLSNMTATATDAFDGTTATTSVFSITIASDTASASLASSNVRQGAAITGTLSTNETSPVWSFSSSPAGLSLTASGSTFSGTGPAVTSPKSYTITATATENSLSASTSQLNLTVYPAMAITAQPTSVSSVVGNNFLPQTMGAVSNNIGTVQWTLKRGGSAVNLSALCAGITFNAATAQIYAQLGYQTGTCSLSNMTATATDSFDGSTVTTSAFSISISGPSAWAILNTSSAVHSGFAIAGNLVTSESSPKWVFVSLPVGMTVTAAGSTFYGSAPAARVGSKQSYYMTATATDNFGSATTGFWVTVYPAMVIATQPTAVSGVVGDNFSAQTVATISNNVGTVSWALEQNGSAATLSSLCPGLSFNSATGQIYAPAGYVTGTCSLSNMTVMATDADGTTTTSTAFSITISADTALATLTSAAVVHQGSAIIGALATNEASPTWSFSSSPSGLTVTAAGSAFSGTAPAVGSPTSYSVTATAAENAHSASSVFSVTVYPVLTASAPANASGFVGNYLTTGTPSTANAIGSVTWSSSGSVVGMSFNGANGVFSGTPTTNTATSITLTAKDATGATASVTFSVTIGQDGQCDANEWACDVGTANNGSISNYTAYWYCQGPNGGANTACSYAIPTSGACGSSEWSCDLGGPNNGSVSGTTAYWNCAGPNGGANTACSYAIPTAGACSSSEWSCDAGTAFGGWIGGGYANWYCAGANGGGNSGQCQYSEPSRPYNIVISNWQDSEYMNEYDWLNQWFAMGFNLDGSGSAQITVYGGTGPYSCSSPTAQGPGLSIYFNGMSITVGDDGYGSVQDVIITCTDSWGASISGSFYFIIPAVLSDGSIGSGAS